MPFIPFFSEQAMGESPVIDNKLLKITIIVIIYQLKLVDKTKIKNLIIKASDLVFLSRYFFEKLK